MPSQKRRAVQKSAPGHYAASSDKPGDQTAIRIYNWVLKGMPLSADWVNELINAFPIKLYRF